MRMRLADKGMDKVRVPIRVPICDLKSDKVHGYKHSRPFVFDEARERDAHAV